MFDTRNLTDVPSFEDKLIPDQYQSLTAVINYAYSKHHGYDFNFVHIDKGDLMPHFSIPWHRVFYFSEKIKKMEHDDACKWFLYVDTDAFVRGFTTPLDEFIGEMSSKYDINEDVGAIFAQEQLHLPEMTWTLHAVNAGVYLVHANQKSQRLFNTWVAAASDDLELETTWPAEQGVLTELVFPGKFVTRLGAKLPDGRHAGAHARLSHHEDISHDLALVNMTEMNSPWGWFVEHVWSGPGWEKRGTDYMEMLESIDAARPDRFASLLSEVRNHISTWVPHASASGK
mmetsp:Transcript_68152/g.106534  ORF Transcript_68152/g.106534 Transcript_68152/m.106534 type:complete len:286 (+) Transcript_68152:3-860(+)